MSTKDPSFMTNPMEKALSSVTLAQSMWGTGSKINQAEKELINGLTDPVMKETL